MSHTMLELIVVPELEFRLVEHLLSTKEGRGFHSFPVQGHGESVECFNAEELVAGKKRNVMFRLFMPQGEAEALIEELGKAFPGSGVRYFLLPVLGSGEL